MTPKPGSFAKRIYLPRLLGSAAGFWAVSVVLDDYAMPTWVWVLLVFHGFVWPHVAYLLGYKVPVPYRVECRNMIVESAFGGLWVAAMQFNALPCTLLVSMFCMNCIAVGGPRLLVASMPMMASTCVVACVFLGASFLPETRHDQVYACLPMLAIYPIAVAWAAYKLAAKLAEHKRQLKEASRFDSLTGLLNQGAWKIFLNEEYTAARQREQPTTLALIDIDHFKAINDTYGHPVGDEVIRLLTATLRDSSRPMDVAGRLGGDEFGLVLRNATASQAEVMLVWLKQCITDAFLAQSGLPRVSLSIGAAQLSEPMAHHLDWVIAADAALYDAKHQGRNRVVISAADESLPRKINVQI
jgi:diguanylate cyclase